MVADFSSVGSSDLARLAEGGGGGAVPSGVYRVLSELLAERTEHHYWDLQRSLIRSLQRSNQSSLNRAEGWTFSLCDNLQGRKLQSLFDRASRRRWEKCR